MDGSMMNDKKWVGRTTLPDFNGTGSKSSDKRGGKVLANGLFVTLSFYAE
jgi:hypothetical protein